MQPPSVGRIVHYHFARNERVVTRPAIIVRVLSDVVLEAGEPGLVNLQVFFDPSDGVAVGDVGTRTRVAQAVEAPTSPGPSPTWSWPPYVPPAKKEA